MRNTYSDSAQLRVAGQGVSAITAFIEELSPAYQEKALATRAPIPGFRKSSPAFFKKQRELLAAAIGHTPNENRRPKNTDWMAFGTIWSLWGRQSFLAYFQEGHSILLIFQPTNHWISSESWWKTLIQAVLEKILTV